MCYGDYKVIRKNVKNNRSSYTVKCNVCGSIKDVYNLRRETHGEHCKNFTSHILGEQMGDFVITNAYREERVYVDTECMVCGCKRNHVVYKDFKSIFKNKHSTTCTVRNLSRYPNKDLVNKLLRTFSNMKTRIKKEPAYKDVEIKFTDSTDFVTYMYPLYEKRLEEGNPLEILSIDRINPFGNYEKPNVRCLTLSEQQKNKRSNYVKESVEAIERSVGDEQVE